MLHNIYLLQKNQTVLKFITLKWCFCIQHPWEVLSFPRRWCKRNIYKPISWCWILLWSLRAQSWLLLQCACVERRLLLRANLSDKLSSDMVGKWKSMFEILNLCLMKKFWERGWRYGTCASGSQLNSSVEPCNTEDLYTVWYFLVKNY